jgi:hypothetical protein
MIIRFSRLIAVCFIWFLAWSTIGAAQEIRTPKPAIQVNKKIGQARPSSECAVGGKESQPCECDEKGRNCQGICQGPYCVHVR